LLAFFKCHYFASWHFLCKRNFASNNVNKQKTKLRNTTDSTDELIGNSNYGNADVGMPSIVVGVFTIAAPKNFELQARCGATQTTYGLGEAASFSISEVYSIIQIVRIA
jgi:hypothetical protein